MNNNALFSELLGLTPNGKQKQKAQAVQKEVSKARQYDFMSAIQETLGEAPYNVSRTENGAIGYKTTGTALLDLNFATSSLRMKSDKEIQEMFMKAYFESPMEAMLWLFYLRDVRGGMGERRSFKVILQKLAKTHPKEIGTLIPYISEYGRYDDLWALLNTPLSKVIIDLVKVQLISDMQDMRGHKPISLLGKWMPSINASSIDTRKYAKQICAGLGLAEPVYRKTCSALRKYLHVVERDMSAKRWSVINYNTVPAKANLIYNNAFLRNDEERRRKYLEDLEKHDGSAKINAGTLFPHEIVHRYFGRFGGPDGVNVTLEELWKALPDTVQEAGNVMVVADGSGSMRVTVDRQSSVTALNVATSLAIYFSERASGPYKDKYITFSTNPQYVDFSKCNSLRDKIICALTHSEVADTNIQKVFEMILDTAVANHLKQEEMPGLILVLSDMEFNACAVSSKPRRSGTSWRYDNKPVDKNLFKYIEELYAGKGYKMPKLVFWNINSRTGTIPVKENNMGVALVSGFSVNTMRMVLSNKLDPYEILLEQLYTERYKPIYEALSPYYKSQEWKGTVK